MPDKCLVEVRKPILPTKKIDIIFRRRRLPNTQFYFTDRKHALPKSGELEQVRSFRTPRSQKLLSYIRYSDRNEKLISKRRLSQPLHMKDNLKIAATRDISQRLYILPPPDDIKTVVDAIQPEFYTAIEGRPLRFFDDINVYISNIRNYAMYRQQIGYRCDKVFKIDLDMQEEIKQCEEVSLNLRQHINNFQRYLTEDYKLACALVSKGEKLYKQVEEQTSEYISLVILYTNTSSLVFKLDSIRNVLKMYRQYLMFAAPLYWRETFDETYRQVSLQFEEGEFVTASEQFIAADTDDLVESLSIEKIVREAMNELRNPPPNYLYFSTPEDTLYLFRTMEAQSRDYLMQLSKTQGPYQILQLSMKKMKELTQRELAFCQYYIDFLNKEIERELCNEVFLQEKFVRILNTTFYDTIASPDVLKLKICVEYVYEQVLDKCEEGHETLRDPTRMLELLYEDYCLRLDELDFKVVTQATSDCYEEDRQMMSAAFSAQRVLKEFGLMTIAMNKAFLPPAKFKRPVFKKFMSKHAMRAAERAAKRQARIDRGERVEEKKFKVSPNDREDLMMFTNWCDGMNPAPFLQDLETYVRPVLNSAAVISSSSINI